ncbi:MAG: hypothetical protein RBT34_03980 [Anaerolineaceae bacterium]|jgi:carbamate kinase|nr:hypothetical protein [Anaerolineaceae bacterium]
MREKLVISIGGEVLASNQGFTIGDQKQKACELANALVQILSSELDIVILHGNKPQIGYVLFRAELASHILHPIPLDVCGADTQGATGYLLDQALRNSLKKNNIARDVITIVTQAVVDKQEPISEKAVGPWFDRVKANQYRQMRGWTITEEPGRGFRRTVPLLPAKEIIGAHQIQKLSETGTIVIAAGGGGIPVYYNEKGDLEGIEAVVQSPQAARIIANEIGADTLLFVIENDTKFNNEKLTAESLVEMSLEEVDYLLKNNRIYSNTVSSILQSASDFLHEKGEKVVITTLKKLEKTTQEQNGLIIKKQFE